MGYYTTYSISLMYLPSENLNLDNYLLDLLMLKDELEKITGYIFNLDEKDQVIVSGEIKWYEYKTHLTQISKNHPNWIIKVDGAGEETGDIWKAYFKDGKYVRYDPKIVFPDFNIDALK